MRSFNLESASPAIDIGTKTIANRTKPTTNTSAPGRMVRLMSTVRPSPAMVIDFPLSSRSDPVAGELHYERHTADHEHRRRDQQKCEQRIEAERRPTSMGAEHDRLRPRQHRQRERRNLKRATAV